MGWQFWKSSRREFASMAPLRGVPFEYQKQSPRWSRGGQFVIKFLVLKMKLTDTFDKRPVTHAKCNTPRYTGTKNDAGPCVWKRAQYWWIKNINSSCALTLWDHLLKNPISSSPIFLFLISRKNTSRWELKNCPFAQKTQTWISTHNIFGNTELKDRKYAILWQIYIWIQIGKRPRLLRRRKYQNREKHGKKRKKSLEGRKARICAFCTRRETTRAPRKTTLL